MSNAFQIEGGPAFAAEVERRLLAAVTPALTAGAQKLLELSNENVPVESGALRDSGRIEVQGEEAAVGYGDPGDATGAYAPRVHEDQSYRHAQGTAKFLEQPLVSRSDDIGRAMTEAVAEAIRRG